MKKTVLAFALGFTLFLGVAGGSAFAKSTLDSTIDGLVGTPYKWAGTSTSGFDCSGFTSYVFDKFGVDLARTSKAQNGQGSAVSKSDLRAGDLVFFNTDGKGISHVGIYIGNNKFAHSASNKGVIKSDLSESYYAKRYVSARRVLGENTFNKVAVD
ncbi:C40 family peptidase [Paenibacillus lutrae]|uniref:NlpC/P60 family protein n=1 Tax=Paenibacillus lutrae TaxID=2078573 RepID=A0A7X3K218_9BACL|nr:C40 family peptidase [Paenibacillus lutrae]MVP02605.1 NlpC/P60 family protein [Paenibacillus lutrae]